MQRTTPQLKNNNIVLLRNNSQKNYTHIQITYIYDHYFLNKPRPTA